MLMWPDAGQGENAVVEATRINAMCALGFTITRRLLCFLTVGWLLCRPALADRKLDWYDEQNQRLRSPALQPLEDPQAPPRWVWKPWQTNNTRRAWRIPQIGELTAQIIEAIIWVALGLGIIWLLVYVLRFIQHQESYAAVEVTAGHDHDAILTQKLAELPFATGSAGGNLLDAAREMYQQANYDQAIVFLFGYQLLELDRHQRIRLWKGKTNRNYLYEVRDDYWLSKLLTETIHTFEASYFGKHAVSREQFESCWERMDRFHQHLETSA